MKIYLTISGCILFTILLTVTGQKEEKKELKIDYIKKIENCQIRSKNGDILHVYRFCFQEFIAYKYLNIFLNLKRL